MSDSKVWLDSCIETATRYRRMIDAAVRQLSDEAFFARPKKHVHSVAVLVRHLGGNLQSRWTNFLTEDGEKPNRNRDQEFEDWPDDRDALMAYFDAGWQCLTDTLDSLSADELTRTVTIRGEPLAVPQAILRSLTHTSYHVGQLLLVARLMHDDDGSWEWLTIPPGGSEAHDAAKWGTSSSRGVAGKRES